MSYTPAGLNAAVNGIAAAGTFVCFFTAAPPSDGTFANEVTGGTYTRQATTWAAAANGSRVGSQTSTSIPAGTTITHWGIASAATGGTLLGSWMMPANESFGSAGTEQFTPTLTAS